jgi:nitrite reductase/ring-hydroxylating ferredoxin subunit
MWFMSEHRPEGLGSPAHSGVSLHASEDDRRSFLSTLAMYTGLLSAYGFFASLAGRFLFPSRPAPKAWQFVAELARMPAGSSISYQTPSGHRVAITRTGEQGTTEDFIALSSTCPHLGCHVHWEAHNNRFFCPCHNGVFDVSGVATQGPPKDAGQSLARYPLKVENGLLFVEVEVKGDPTA